MCAQKRYIAKKNADPDGRIRSKEELRATVEHVVQQEQKEELEAPEQFFVELSKLKKAPAPDKIVTKSFGGTQMKGVLVSTGPAGWWKVKHSESTSVASKKTEVSEDFDIRENQHVLQHIGLAQKNLSAKEEVGPNSVAMSFDAILQELEDDAQGLLA